MDYSPWGCKDSDMTGRLTLSPFKIKQTKYIDKIVKLKAKQQQQKNVGQLPVLISWGKKKSFKAEFVWLES